jgi:hypothetical protein
VLLCQVYAAQNVVKKSGTNSQSDFLHTFYSPPD